jgi:hypothetical protein
MNKNITVAQLDNLKESNSLNSNSILKIDYLIEAIDDWPSKIDSVDDFLSEIKSFLKIEDLNYESISSKMTELNPAHYAWQLESLSSVKNILLLERGKTLDIIFDDLISGNGN